MSLWAKYSTTDEAAEKLKEMERYQRKEVEYKRAGNNKALRTKEERTQQRKAARASRKRNRQ